MHGGLIVRIWGAGERLLINDCDSITFAWFQEATVSTALKLYRISGKIMGASF